MYFFDKGAKLEIQFTKGGKARWAARVSSLSGRGKKEQKFPFPRSSFHLSFSRMLKETLPSFFFPSPPSFYRGPRESCKKKPVASATPPHKKGERK